MPKNEGIESEKELMQHINAYEKIATSTYRKFSNKSNDWYERAWNVEIGSKVEKKILFSSTEISLKWDELKGERKAVWVNQMAEKQDLSKKLNLGDFNSDIQR